MRDSSNATVQTEETFLRTTAAAKFLGVSPRYLESLRVKGGGPVFYRLGNRRCVRYKFEDLADWAEEGRSLSTSDQGRES